MISLYLDGMCILAVWIFVTLFWSQTYRDQPLHVIPIWAERCDLISHTEVFLHVWVFYVVVMISELLALPISHIAAPASTWLESFVSNLYCETRVANTAWERCVSKVSLDGKEDLSLKCLKAVYCQGRRNKKGVIFQNPSGGSLEAELRYPERNWNPRVWAWWGEEEGTAAAAMQSSIASYHIRPLPLQRPTINTGYPTEQTENNMLPHNVSYEKCPQSLQYIFCFGLGL